MRVPWIYASFFFAFFLIFTSISAQPDYFHTSANLSTTWTNNESSISSTDSSDGARIRVILGRYGYSAFTCGFFCNGTCTSYLFAILINYYDDTVTWSANRDHPVREGALLNLTAAGELVLQDVDGSIAWTSNTVGKGTVGMNLTDEGNLVLFDGHNSMVWQSFDHPTDCLVSGQKLFQGQKLIASVSSTNWTAQKDLYSLQHTDEGLFAYVETNPPQVYFYHLKSYLDDIHYRRSYVQFVNGSLSFFYGRYYPYIVYEILNAKWEFEGESPFGYIKLMPDGQLKAVGWSYEYGYEADLLSGPPEWCFYPLACGRNAICLDNKQCSCPGTGYFRAVNDHQPNKGCFQVTPLTCNTTQDQDFIEIKNVSYVTYTATMQNVDMENCKQACLEKCSCKAALFEYGSNSSSGDCYMFSELFTMTSTMNVNTSAFIKIQNVRSECKIVFVFKKKQCIEKKTVQEL